MLTGYQIIGLLIYTVLILIIGVLIGSQEQEKIDRKKYGK